MKKYIAILAMLVLSLSAFTQKLDSLQKSKDLEEIVILANKFVTIKKEQANQIQIITKKEISFQNAPNTADLLSNTGKAYVQKSQAGGGSPILRGFEANKILLVVDGVRMNNAIFRGGHLQNVLRVDQNSLESVELIFGPGSILYGSDALGGTISLRTKNPILENINLGAFFRYSTASNEKSNHLDFNLGSKKVASWTSFTFGDFGDIRQGANRNSKYAEFGKRPNYVETTENVDNIKINNNPNVQVGSAYQQFDLVQKFLIKTNEKVSHLFNIQYSITGNVNRYDRLTEIRNQKLRFAEWYYGPEKRFLGSYKLSLGKSKLYDKAEITLAYQDIEESRISRSLNASNRKSQIENVKVFSLNADFLKEFYEMTIQYGLEGISNKVDSKANFTNILNNIISPADTRYPSGGSSLNSFASYLKYKSYYQNRKLILDAGLRLSYYSLQAKFTDKTFFPFPFDEVNQNNFNLSSSVGLVYLPNKSSKYNFMISQGFRVPNVDDIGKVFDSTPGTLIVPNPNLKPEKSYTFELGFDKQIGIINLEMVYYTTLLADAIAVSSFNLDGKAKVVYQNIDSKVMASQNLGSANISGLYFNISAKINKNISLSSSYNLTKGSLKDSLKTPLDHIPPAYGRTVLRYSKSKFYAEFYANYNSWKYIEDYSPSGEDNQIYATPEGMPSWITFNFKSNISLNKNFETQLGIENIFDKNYRFFASGISAPGRNLLITLRYKI